eukprot:1955710-Heterocapsa_arctica.AAC.2
MQRRWDPASPSPHSGQQRNVVLVRCQELSVMQSGSWGTSDIALASGCRLGPSSGPGAKPRAQHAGST